MSTRGSPVGATLRVAPDGPKAEMFCEPSAEALRLLRYLGPLTTPPEGRDHPALRGLRHLMVAPFTQLTFRSFDLQMFLFDVFHTTPLAKGGHMLGMTSVVLFAFSLVVAAAGPVGGAVVAAGLLAWYAAMAAEMRLPLWWAAMVVVVGVLLALGGLVAASMSPLALVGGLLGSALMVSLSHAFEPWFPPRAGDPFRWLSFREYLLGPATSPVPPRTTALRLVRMGAYAVIGWPNELWASPRLLPHNVLRAMLAFGYAPALKAVLDDRARRALASGNPALDYVGIGGGTFLAPPVG